MVQRNVTAMATPFWLVRPRPDGGCDYVSFLPDDGPPGSGTVEISEGSHLPPQMPLLKRRHRLAREEAEARCMRLQKEGGYRSSDPLF
jgi:hypothetical protein